MLGGVLGHYIQGMLYFQRGVIIQHLQYFTVFVMSSLKNSCSYDDMWLFCNSCLMQFIVHHVGRSKEGAVLYVPYSALEYCICSTVLYLPKHSLPAQSVDLLL